MSRSGAKASGSPDRHRPTPATATGNLRTLRQTSGRGCGEGPDGTAPTCAARSGGCGGYGPAGRSGRRGCRSRSLRLPGFARPSHRGCRSEKPPRRTFRKRRRQGGLSNRLRQAAGTLKAPRRGRALPTGPPRRRLSSRTAPGGGARPRGSRSRRGREGPAPSPPGREPAAAARAAGPAQRGRRGRRDRAGRQRVPTCPPQRAENGAGGGPSRGGGGGGGGGGSCRGEPVRGPKAAGPALR